jgi:hypothetical protein
MITVEGGRQPQGTASKKRVSPADTGIMRVVVLDRIEAEAWPRHTPNKAASLCTRRSILNDNGAEPNASYTTTHYNT